MIRLETIDEYASLDEVGLILALKLIELRVYIDISYTEEIIKNLKEEILYETVYEYQIDKPENYLLDLTNVFLEKINWFKDWITEKDHKLESRGIKNIDNIDIYNIVNEIEENDLIKFKRKKVLKEVMETVIYENEELYEYEHSYNISYEEMCNILKL